jgi:hypothetical protein
LSHLETNGIVRHVSCPGTPEQNGVAEWKHRHIVEIGLTMLFHAQLPKHFWVDAFMTAVYLINRLPSSILKLKTPFFKLHGTHPDYNSLKVFGCRCFPYLRDYAKNKFTPKSYLCVFLGYSPMHKGYRCLHPPSKRVYLSRHVIFDETIFPYANPTLLFSPAKQNSIFSTFTEFTGGFFTPSSSGLSDAPTNPEMLPCSRPPIATTQVTSNFSHTTILSPLVDPSSSQTMATNQPTQPVADATPLPNHAPDRTTSLLDAPCSTQAMTTTQPTPTVADPTTSPNNAPFYPDDNATSPLVESTDPQRGDSSNDLTNHTLISLDASSSDPQCPSSAVAIPIHPGELYIELPPIPVEARPSAPSSLNVHPMVTRRKARAHLGLVSSRSTPPMEPRNLPSAFQSPHWFQAMKDELAALHQQRTWDLVPRNNSMNVIGSRWVFTTKLKSDGSIERFKARLVAKGYNQLEGIDFTETFSPVIKPTTIRLVLSLVIIHGWPIRQLDVKNTFLHGHLKKVVYMEQPPGFPNPTSPTHVCRLRKAIYGLKQAPRVRFDRFSSFLLHLGFTCNRVDSSLFVFRSHTTFVLLLVYVDDIIVTSNQAFFFANLIF